MTEENKTIRLSFKAESSDGSPHWSGDLSSTITQIPALTEQITEALYKAIVAGQIPVNTRLSEAALAKSFGVSRTPVREAMRQLAGEGLLRFDRGRGAIVPAINPQEVLDAYQVRTQLFALAANLAAQRAIPEEKLELERTYQRMEERVAEEKPDEYFWELVNFFSIMVRAARNSVLSHWLERQRYIAWVAERVGIISLHAPGTIDASLSSFKSLLEALLTGDAETAERVVRVVLTRTLERTLPIIEAEGSLGDARAHSAATRPDRHRRGSRRQSAR